MKDLEFILLHSRLVFIKDAEKKPYTSVVNSPVAVGSSLRESVTTSVLSKWSMVSGFNIIAVNECVVLAVNPV